MPTAPDPVYVPTPQEIATYAKWVPNPGETTRFIESMSRQRVRDYPWLYEQLKAEKRNVFCWEPLLQCKPSWRRGAQGIGDCTSWGWELGTTLVMAAMDRLGIASWIEEGATEASYGGARVEANGGKLGGYSDGWYGSGLAKWHTGWGVILRLDYSKETGVKEHDLRKYDSKKAKEWGNFGCGGKEDAGRGEGLLDKVAKQWPVIETPLVLKVDELAASVTNGYPVAVCSGVGFGDMKRNAEGIVKRSGSWQHCMLIGGIRWRNGQPEFRLFQSWGKSCSGPDPGIDHSAVSDCSWWIVAEDAQRILDERDSFAVGFIKGMPPQIVDWSEIANEWNFALAV